MKKITFLFLLLGTSLGFSQQQQYNLGFEPSTPSGVLSNWITFEGPNPVAEIVTNPDPDGDNTSATTKVLKLNMVQGAACYAGTINSHGTLGTWKLDSAVPSNLTLSMQVNKSIVGKVGIKFANATNATLFEIKDDQGLVSAVNQWVTLTWDISGFNVGDNVNIDQMVIFIDWRCTGETARPSDVQLLVDNITWGANKLTDPATCSDGIQNGTETGVDCGGTCAPCLGQAPLVAAPTPPSRAIADVISIYSNAYSNVTLSELPTSWSQLTAFEPVLIDGNDTWKMTGCEFLGMVTNYDTGVDLSTMEKMHIDYWTPDTNGIGVKIVNTVDGGEAIASLGTTVTGSWQSIDVDMTDFAALSNKTKITQLLIDPSAPSILFIDNFYFYKVTAGSTCSDGIQNGDETGIDCGGSCTPCLVNNPTVAAPTPPARNAFDVISIYSNAYSNVTLSELPTSWSQLTAFEPVLIDGNDTWKMTGCEFLGMVTNYDTGVDMSAMEKMHIDYWTPDTNPIGVKIVNTVDGGEAIASLGTTVTGAWQSIDINMSDFAALSNKTKITQLLIDPSAPSKLFIDNFYFYKGLPLSNQNFASATFRMYPNPANDNLNITTSSSIDSIEIYNALGQIVAKENYSSKEVSIHVSNLSKGFYILSAQIGTESVRKQFVKE
jgi:Secretion system C-terminal sorting domain